MIPSFYDSSEKIAALLAEVELWQGTPFRENSAVAGAGGGVSCHNLVCSLYFATGALKPFVVPRGSARRLLHNPADTMLRYIDEHLCGRFAKIELAAVENRIEAICPGDLLILSEGRISKHVAIALPGEQPEHAPRLVHVLMHVGTSIGHLSDPTYLDALVEVRRPLPWASLESAALPV